MEELVKMTHRERYWKTPKLIILARNNQEESVLLACKRAAMSIGEFGQGNQYCESGVQGNCAACQARGNS